MSTQASIPPFDRGYDDSGRGAFSPAVARWLSIGLLLAVNCYPLVLVLTRTWLPGDVLIAYWVENVAIGVWSVVRIMTARGAASADPGGHTPRRLTVTMNGRSVGSDWKRPALAMFFVGHFGIFTLVHGVFTVIIALWAGVGASILSWVGMFVISLVSHGVSTVVYWFRLGERDLKSPEQAMLAPYARIFIMQFVVIASFFVLVWSLGGRADGGLFAGQSRLDYHLFPAVLLVVIRTAIDLIAHLRQHRRAA